MADRVCVLGLGKSGVAAARHLVASGSDVTVYAGDDTAHNRTAALEFANAGVDVVFGTQEVEGHYDLCVVSPGISELSGFYQSALAASDELVSEPEYAWRLSPDDWVAITGTNGKTTATSLTAHVLEGCGHPAAACGNIGATCTAAVEKRREGETLVAEMSSFQLASTIAFTPRVAVLLNITPDHVEWHGTHEAYAEAKLKVFENLGEGQTAIVCDAVPDADALVESLRGRGVHVVTVGSRRDDDCAWADESGMLCFRLNGCSTLHLIDFADLQLRGSHNVENVLVSAAIALDLGCAPEQVANALCTFAPLEHRIEPVATVGGVAFYNDSKATNVDATVKALTAFAGREIVLMIGGHDKMTDLAELVETASDACRVVVCYGEAAMRFGEAFSGANVRLAVAPHMQDAFEMACEMARPGEVVLLSPACSSFDEFDSYTQRGAVFKDLVREYRARKM